MKATILERPATFDRVDRVKQALIDAGEPTEGIRTDDHKLWILGSPLIFKIDDSTHEVPTGFTTDGASIPWWGQKLTGWDPWEPPQRWAAIVHDWLYCEPGAPKAYADHVFAELLRSEGANPWQRNVMYLAVVLGGGHAYRIDQGCGPMIYVKGGPMLPPRP